MADIQTTLKTTVANDINWLKHHIIALLVVALLVAGAVYGVDSLIAKHDAAKESKDAQILALVVSQTNDLKARLLQDETSTAAKDAVLVATIQGLNGTIAKQSAQLQSQININATLNAAQTAQAIAAKTNSPDVSAQNNNVMLGINAARTVNSDLDRLATTSAQLDERTQQLAAQTGLTSNATVKYQDATAVIASQNTQVIQADKVCNDKIAVVKSDARKSKFKWFLGGYVAGFLSRQLLKP